MVTVEILTQCSEWLCEGVNVEILTQCGEWLCEGVNVEILTRCGEWFWRRLCEVLTHNKMCMLEKKLMNTDLHKAHTCGNNTVYKP